MAALKVCITIPPLHQPQPSQQFHATNHQFCCTSGALRWVGPKMPRIGPGLRIRAPAMASLRDEKEAPSSGERVDFDAKLPPLCRHQEMRKLVKKGYILSLQCILKVVVSCFVSNSDRVTTALALCNWSKITWTAPSVFQRRFLLGTSTGVLIALGADFLGITSAILSSNPALFQSIRADVLYPIQGYKRSFEASNGFEFIFPKTWVGDQRLLYQSVQRGEKERALDLPSLQQQSKRKSIDPIVAFGPPGSNGELNVSVVVAPTVAGFTLEQLGGPMEAGTIILRRFIAPESSNKMAKLLSAEKRSANGVVYYTLEYTVQGPSFSRHNVAVYATNAGELFSLNAQAAEVSWSTVQDQFRVIADSFKLLP